MIRILVAAALVASLTPAGAQPSMRERAVVAPGMTIKSLVPQQSVVLNEGGYALVDNKSVSDRHKVKKAEATCPAGMKAVSAGFSAASGAGEPKDYRPILSKPSDSGDGWVVYARFDGKGDSLAADYDWELRIRVVCLKPG